MTEEGNLFHVYSVAEVKPRPVLSRVQLAKVKSIFLLRLSLAAVFFWFGLLKFTGVSPVVALLNNTFPVLAQSPCIEMLGLAEMAIAVGLVIERLSKYAASLMIVHLFGTLSVIYVAPSLIFAPSFPVLTMTGEFIVKNFVFIIAGLLVIESRKR